MKKNRQYKIVDLDDVYRELFFLCLEDWSDELKEAGDHKAKWFGYMKDRGLRVKLALDGNGAVGGMIQYIPVENSFVDGKDIYVIQCIWVHGYKKGRGNFQKRGMGTALIREAESDVRSLGAKGLAAWGIALPFWMKASWFKKQGYVPVDRMGFLGQVLLWKPFAEEAVAPCWIRPHKKPGTRPGKVLVTSFLNGWCPAQNLVYERARRAAAEFGDSVEFQMISTLEPEKFREWGISDALFIDGKSVRTGPPPSYEKIRKLISRRVQKL